MTGGMGRAGVALPGGVGVFGLWWTVVWGAFGHFRASISFSVV